MSPDDPKDDDLMVAKIALKEALDVPVAYLHAPFPYGASSPLDIEFFWDEDGIGSVATMNLASEMIEKFSDDPEYYRDAIPKVVQALRMLANELENLCTKSAHPYPENTDSV